MVGKFLFKYLLIECFAAVCFSHKKLRFLFGTYQVGFYLFVFIVVFSSPLTLSKCHWHFFTSGRSFGSILTITALRLTACTVLLKVSPLRGDL
jgi:hypothetical protein